MTDSAPTSTWPHSRTDSLLGIWLWCVAVVFVCGLILADPDLWGHTLYGIRAWQQGVLVERTDPFSYTAPGATWINHEWLTELQLGLIYQAWGNPGLWMWRNAWVVVLFLCVGSELSRQRASLGARMLLLMYGALCLSQFVVFARPQVPTLALFTLTLTLLKRHSDGIPSRGLWCLPLLMAVWVNLHGGFLAGIGIIAVYSLLEIFRNLQSGGTWNFKNLQLPLIGIASVLATLLNPYGYQMHLMLWEHLATEQFVVEWQPLWVARQVPTYYVPLVLLAIALPFSRCWNLGDAIVLVVIGSQAVSHIRHVGLLAVACLILLPGPLSESLPRLFPHLSSRLQLPGRGYLKVIGVGSVSAVLILLQLRGTIDLWRHGLAPWHVGVESRSPVPGMPVRAVTFLNQAKLNGNLLTDYGWAQFMFWQAPQFKLAFDGRYRTVYSSQLESEFLSFQRSGRTKPSQTPMLDKYPTEVVMLPIGSNASGYVASRPDFAEVYRDDQAVIWLRRLPRFEPLLKNRKPPYQEIDAPPWQPFPAVAKPKI